MDPALLRTFLAIHDAGSLTAAARHLAMSQSALTKKLRRLEDELRVPLFERHNRGLIPTAIGRVLAGQAQLLQSGLDATQEMVAQFRAGTRGHVRIGASALAAAVMLPRITVRLRTLQPMIRMTVVEGLPQELTGAVRAGRVDFALCSSPNHDDRSDLDAEIIAEDHFGAIAARDYELPARGRLRLAALAEHPWVLTPYAGEPRRWFAEQFERAGARPPIPAVESASLPYFRELVTSGAFLGFAPREMFDAELQQGTVRPVMGRDFVLSRPVAVMTRRNAILSPADRLVLDLLRGEARSSPPYGQRRRGL